MNKYVLRLLLLFATLLASAAFPRLARASVTYTNPTMFGLAVGTAFPQTGSTAAETARRFCQDQGFVGELFYATSIQSTAYMFIAGTGGAGSWDKTNGTNVTILDSIICDNSLVTYTSPFVNGFPVGTIYPAFGSTAAETAHRFCVDQNYLGAPFFTTSIRSIAYTYINGTHGNGNWSTTGNANVTVLDSITCDNSGVVYTGPMVNGFFVGTIYPATGSSAADTARRFCQDQGFVSAVRFGTSVRSTAYSYVVGAGGAGNWNTTGNANVTMLDSITCSNSAVVFTNPMVNGFSIGTIFPATGSNAADTARRYCQDHSYVSAPVFSTSIRSTAYSCVTGSSGDGSWNTTGNANVTMVDSITCTY